MSLDEVRKYLLFGMTKEQARGAAMFAYRATTITYVAWSLGILSYIHMGDGFVYASDQLKADEATQALVRNVDSDLRKARQTDMEAKAFELQVTRCIAVRDGKSTLLYTLQLEHLNTQYKELMKVDMRIPSCGDLQ